MMYDECAVSIDSQKNANCFYNGPAKSLTDQEGLNILLEFCPYLYNNEGETFTCCSTSQLKSLKSNMGVPYQLLSRCPACFRNFVALFCQMACAPDQSLYTNATIITNSSDSAHYTPIKKDRMFVQELEYTIKESFANGMYDSCKNVMNPQTGKPSVELFCGSYASNCSAHHMIDYLGDYSNHQTPFQITSIYKDDSGMNYSATSCNSDFPLTGDGPCSCADCPTTCPAPVPPPDLAQPWTITLDGYYAVMILTYFIIITVFNIIVYYISVSRVSVLKKIEDAVFSDLGEVQPALNQNIKLSGFKKDLIIEPPTSSSNLSCRSKIAFYIEQFLHNSFQKIGTYCAYNPVKVLFAGLLVVIICGCGLTKMQITTDPVELWSAPTSTARVQKEYFDKHFGPFYRTEQLIITAPNSTNSTFTANGIDYNFGSILQKDILHEILNLQNEIFEIKASYQDRNITLKDICLKPLEPHNNECGTMSVVNWFQNNHANIDTDFFGLDYHNHLISCTKNPETVSDETELSCLGDYGGPIFPWVALGGFDAKNYLNATAAVVTVPAVNYYDDAEKVAMAMAWESKFIDFMKNFTSRPGSNLSIAFSSERSIEDEINRESSADVTTILLSYLIMFAYVAIALGRLRGCTIRRVLIELQLTVGLSGVVIVLFSVIMSLGIFSYAGMPLTLIIVEVVPFLALAVGVDNIFIIVQHYHRDKRGDETREEQLGRVLGEVAPGIFMSALSETIAFFLGGLSNMPAVRTFSMFAGLAVFCDFLLQITCFVAVLSLDSKRKESNKYDCMCCFQGNEAPEAEKDGYLYAFFKNYFAPFVLNRYIRLILLYIFIGFACFSGSNLHKIEIGLDQSLSMPSDSYVLDYFDYMAKYLSTGAPVYFVVEEGQNYSSVDGSNQVCGGAGCNQNSLVSKINQESFSPNYSTIAYPASSWLDDYYDWLKPLSQCCYYNASSDPYTFCNASVKSDDCTTCRSLVQFQNSHKPNQTEFMDFLPWFLSDNPGIQCSKGGHASYAAGVNIIANKNRQSPSEPNTTVGG